MRRSSFIIGLIVAALSRFEVLAHSDTILKYRWGRIYGLPDHYSPARYDQRDFKLVIGKQIYTFPDFLIEIIKTHSAKPELIMHASWYHQGDAYLSINFSRGKNDAISCLFLLDDLSIMSVTRDIPQLNGYRTESIDLTEDQKRQIREALQ
jgi:hypothetical protein